MKSLSEDWVEVYHGIPAVAELVHARLRDGGVLAFVPDRHLRYVDPDSTGGSVFELRVLVARQDSARARELLEIDATEGAKLDPSTENAVETHERDVRRLGERIIAAATLMYVSPYALFLAPRYFRLARALTTRPRGYRMVQGAMALALLQVAAVATLALLGLA